MATKRKPSGKKRPQSKRIVAELAPAVRAMLEAHVQAFNEGSDRASSPLKYTDVVNRALDELLPKVAAAAVEGPEPAGIASRMDPGSA